jgi:hypothetical protein
LPGDVSSTGVVNGDLDCDQELTFSDILWLLQHVATLALQDPMPAADCVPVGHYYNVSQ